MRVIAGTLRRRTLQAPAGLATRPTSDRLRETLFNVLAPRIEGAAFLDLYAGSGAVGIEALSRGAARVVCVERAPGALKVLRTNLERLEIRAGIQVEAVAVQAFLRRTMNANPRSPKSGDPGHPAQSAVGEFDVVFLDPPYEVEAEYQSTLGMLGGVVSVPRSQDRDRGHPTPPHGRGPVRGDPGMERSFLNSGALVIAEHRRKARLEERYGELKRTRLLEQGDAALSFYEAAVSC